MDPISRVFNFLSDPKGTPNIDVMGNPIDQNPVVSSLTSPHLLLAVSVLIGGAMMGHKIDVFLTLMLAGLHIYVSKTRHDTLKAIPPLTIIKQPGVSDPGYELMTQGYKRQMLIDGVLWGAFAYMMIGHSALRSIATGEPLPSQVSDIAFLTYVGADYVRQALRKRMTVKGHWHAVKGKKLPAKKPKEARVRAPAIKGWKPA